MKLTQKVVDGLTLPAGKQEHTFRDDDIKGFGVRLRSGGSRKYVFVYEVANRQKKVTLGDCSAIRAEKARTTASELYAKVRLGGDPARDKEVARAKAEETFEAALRIYLPLRQQKQRPRGFAETSRHLLSHALPLHPLPLADIQRRDIASLLSKVTASAGEVTANRVRTSLMAFFAWSIAEGLRDDNPVMGTARHAEQSRERVLTDGELALIWQNLEEDDFGAILKLLVLTAARANEIAALRWDEIEGGEIHLPASRTKNGRPHVIPLSAAARSILDAQAKRRPGREFVFGKTSGPFIGLVKPRIRLDERIAAAGAALPRWTPHDIRRTAATRMAELGIAQPHIVEAILNHVSGHKAGVAGIYNRASYEAEKRRALASWALHVDAVLTGRESGNVLRLHR